MELRLFDTVTTVDAQAAATFRTEDDVRLMSLQLVGTTQIFGGSTSSVFVGVEQYKKEDGMKFSELQVYLKQENTLKQQLSSQKQDI